MFIYDKILKPRTYRLADGTEVEEKQSRVPLFILGFVLLLGLSIYFTDFQFSATFANSSQFWDILIAMFPPDTSYMVHVWQPLADTIKMSFIGSLLGSLIAVPFAILASHNIVPSRIVNQIVRIIFSLLRTLPTLVTALIATYFFGLGTFAGTLAIFIFSFSYIGKQLFEQIETVDMGAFEAVESMGATKAKAFSLTIIPQILPIFISTSLFNFEGNVRYASILGYVGAGGIGFILNDRTNLRDYTSVGMILITLLVAVIVIESLSQYIRNRLT